MVPALQPGDRLVVISGPRARTGDLVAIRDPRDPGRVLVKRVESCSSSGLEVIGDNPTESTDSRQFGVVPSSALVGIAVYRYFPPSSAGRLRR